MVGRRVNIGKRQVKAENRLGIIACGEESGDIKIIWVGSKTL